MMTGAGAARGEAGAGGGRTPRAGQEAHACLGGRPPPAALARGRRVGLLRRGRPLPGSRAQSLRRPEPLIFSPRQPLGAYTLTGRPCWPLTPERWKLRNSSRRPLGTRREACTRQAFRNSTAQAVRLLMKPTRKPLPPSPPFLGPSALLQTSSLHGSRPQKAPIWNSSQSPAGDSLPKSAWPTRSHSSWKGGSVHVSQIPEALAV